MFKIRSSCLVAVTLCNFFLSGCLFAQSEQSNDEFSDLLRSKTKELSTQEINEIISIRERLGGGTGLELDRLFVEQVQKNAPKEDGKTKVATQPSPVLREPEPTQSRVLFTKPTARKSVDVANLSNYRKIARKMEELAADLEDLEPVRRRRYITRTSKSPCEISFVPP